MGQSILSGTGGKSHRHLKIIMSIDGPSILALGSYEFSKYASDNSFSFFPFIRNIWSLMPCFAISWFSFLYTIKDNSYFLCKN